METDDVCHKGKLKICESNNCVPYTLDKYKKATQKSRKYTNLRNILLRKFLLL